jgi:putative glutamine amidotransferase
VTATGRGHRPVVGITTYVTRAQYGQWDLEAALVPMRYVDAVEAVGGRAVLLPPSADSWAETLGAIDALVLGGGPDIDPGLYGERRHPRTEGVDRRRDDAELALARACLERGLAVLGICRGAQVLNVAAGGTIIQHIADSDINSNITITHRSDEAGVFVEHRVSINSQSRLGAIMGVRAEVKSRHHQGLGRLGAGLRAVAAADDGLVEAIEAPHHEFVLGVLWHDEMSNDMPLIRALVRKARRSSSRIAAW